MANLPPVHARRPFDRPGYVWIGTNWLAEDKFYRRRQRKRLEQHRPKEKESRRRRQMARFDLTVEQYDVMFGMQEGCCAICGEPETAKSPDPDRQYMRLAVDHDHETGEVRALLCRACNTALGKFKESREILQRASDYLERHGR